MTDAQENLSFPWALVSFIPSLLPDAQRMTETSEFKGRGIQKASLEAGGPCALELFGSTPGKML